MKPSKAKEVRTTGKEMLVSFIIRPGVTAEIVNGTRKSTLQGKAFSSSID